MHPGVARTFAERAKDHSRRFPIYASAFLFLGFICLWQFQLHREATFQRERIANETNCVKLEIAETLNQTSLALSRYAARIAYIGIQDKGYLNLDSSLYLEQLPILKRIGITDSNYKVIWSYPKEIASQVRGFDEGSNQLRREAMEEARKNRAPSLSRAVDLRSGGVGFLLPVPLYVKGKFLGIVYATVEAARLFHSFVSGGGKNSVSEGCVITT
jgi:sensor domain CHASE-containing protein